MPAIVRRNASASPRVPAGVERALRTESDVPAQLEPAERFSFINATLKNGGRVRNTIVAGAAGQGEFKVKGIPTARLRQVVFTSRLIS
jgi:hypothetical protein